MTQNPLFGFLLGRTYDASGTTEPIERFYASMFAGYFSQTDSQPSCVAVQAIRQGKSKVPRKLLHYYWDPSSPRCPEKLAQDLTALADCFFWSAAGQKALRNCLESYLQILPAEDREDLLDYVASINLIRIWTVLTWYALCDDHHE